MSMMNGNAASGTAKNIYSWSYTGNALLSISLMNDPAAKRSHQIFAFISFIPGERGDGGGRTFNFQNRIVFKFDLNRLDELYYYIRSVASQKDQAEIGQGYALYVDSSKSGFGNGEKKTLSVRFADPSQNQNQSNSQVKTVMISASSSNGRRVHVAVPVPVAYVIADMCKKIFEKGIDLDIETYQPYSGGGNGNSYGNNNRYSQSPRSNNQNSGNNFFGGSNQQSAYPSESTGMDDVPF